MHIGDPFSMASDDKLTITMRISPKRSNVAWEDHSYQRSPASMQCFLIRCMLGILQSNLAPGMGSLFGRLENRAEACPVGVLTWMDMLVETVSVSSFHFHHRSLFHLSAIFVVLKMSHE